MNLYDENQLVERVAVDFGLTDRQFEVLVQAAGGYNRKEIANNLGIAYSTVSEHLKQIYKKLSVKNRSAAVAAAFNYGLVNPGPTKIAMGAGAV